MNMIPNPNNLPLPRAPRRLLAESRCLVGALALLVMSGYVSAAGFDDESHVVIKARKVIVGDGEEYSPGTVVLTDGKVALVGTDIEYPSDADVIEAPTETVMPGLVLPRTRYGLRDYSRRGINGDQKVEDEVYLDLIDFDDLLELGFTTVGYVPDGDGITGIASVYRTAGPDDARIIADAGFIDAALRWDQSGKGKATLRGALKKAKEEIEKVEKAREEWEEKQKKKAEEEKKKEKEKADQPKPEEKPKSAAGDNGEPEKKPDKKEGDGGAEKKEEKFEPPPIDPKLQPLVDLLQKKENVRIMVRVQRASDLLHLDDVLGESEDYEHIEPVYYLANALWRFTDYHYVVQKLGEREARVVVTPGVSTLPYTTNRYNLIDALSDAGCHVAALPERDAPFAYRQLRMRLAESVREGLSRESAIKAMTGHAAAAVGAADRVGSLEKDRDGDLAFFDGDPLDPRSKVTRIMVRGEIVWKAEDE